MKHVTSLSTMVRFFLLISLFGGSIAQTSPYIFSSNTTVTNFTSLSASMATDGFTINSGVTVTWQDTSGTAISGTITINGTFVNEKTLNNHGSCVNNHILLNAGTISNSVNGTILNAVTALIFNADFIDNTGTITNNATFNSGNSGFYNEGVFSNNTGGTLTNSVGAYYQNNYIMAFALGSICNGVTTTLASFPVTTLPGTGGTYHNSGLGDGIIVPLLVDGNSVATTGGTFTPTKCSDGFVVATNATATIKNGTIINAGGKATINYGATLLITSDATLATNTNAVLINFGTLSNNGSIINNAVYNGGNYGFYNDGIFSNNAGGTLTNNVGAYLENNGVMAFAVNSICNGITISIASFPTTTLPGTGGIYDTTNDSVIVPLLVDGNIIATTGGTYTPAQCINGFSVDQNATVSIKNDLTINFNGIITINTDAIFSIASGTKLTIAGTLNNNGTIITDALSTITNTQTLSNAGTIVLALGSIVNDHSVTAANFPATNTSTANSAFNPGFGESGNIIPLLINGNTIATTGGTFTPAQCTKGFMIATNASVAINNDVTLAANKNIILPQGSILTIATGITLDTNIGTLTNNGTVALAIGSKINGTTVTAACFPATNTFTANGLFDPEFSGSGSVVPLVSNGNTIATTGGTVTPTQCANGFIVAANASGIMNNNVTLASGSTITINTGATLSIPSGTMLTCNGTLTNNGTLANNGAVTLAIGSAVNGNTVAIANFPATNTATANSAFNPSFSGSGMVIPLLSNGNIIATTGGTFTPTQCTTGFAIAPSASVTISNNVTLASGSTITINTGATLIIPSGTILTCNGTLTNNGTVTNNGAVALSIDSTVNGNTIVVGNFPTSNTSTANSAFNPGFGGNGVTIPFFTDGNTVATTGGTFTPAQCINGFVVAPSALVTLNARVSITNAAGNTLIDTASVLIISAGKTLTTSCPIINNGIIANAGTVSTTGNGSITNNETMAFTHTAKLNTHTFTTAYAKQTNTALGVLGQGNIVPYLLIGNSITAKGNKPNQFIFSDCVNGFVIAPNATATLSNALTTKTTAHVLIPNNASLLISAKQTLTNNGFIQMNNGTIINNGTLVNNTRGKITGIGLLAGTGTISNKGTITIHGNSSL